MIFQLAVFAGLKITDFAISTDINALSGDGDREDISAVFVFDAVPGDAVKYQDPT